MMADYPGALSVFLEHINHKPGSEVIPTISNIPGQPGFI